MKKIFVLIVCLYCLAACDNYHANKIYSEAETLLSQHEYELVIPLYQQILEKYPKSKISVTVEKQLEEVRTKQQLITEHLTKAENFKNQFKYEEGLKELSYLSVVELNTKLQAQFSELKKALENQKLNAEIKANEEMVIRSVKLFSANGFGKKYAKTLFQQIKKFDANLCQQMEKDYRYTYDYHMKLMLEAAYTNCIDVSYNWQAASKDNITWEVKLVHSKPRSVTNKVSVYSFIVNLPNKTISGDENSCVYLDSSLSGKIRKEENPNWIEMCKFPLLLKEEEKTTPTEMPKKRKNERKINMAKKEKEENALETEQKKECPVLYQTLLAIQKHGTNVPSVAIKTARRFEELDCGTYINQQLYQYNKKISPILGGYLF